ncbi:MAG: hypothetical protein J7M24_03635, partial [Candidatus Latescibacteria bacterium]|nr:hypothetical protein [Candidatus Latescibacterota bacterium]
MNNRMTRRRALAAGAAGLAAAALPPSRTHGRPVSREKSTVSFVTGNDRADMVKRALKPFERRIRDGIRGRRVVVKINMPSKLDLLSLTHPDAVRGLLDFCAPMYDGEFVIAECTLAKEGLKKLSAGYGY